MTRFENLLWCLSEECNEVAQRASKTARFGLEEIQPGQELTNKQRLEQEFGDLLGIWELLVEEYLIDSQGSQAMRHFIQNKKSKFKKFEEYSKKCGTINEI